MLYTVKNHSFTNSEVASTIAPTTTISDNRSRYTSGIFLPTFYQSQQNTAPQAGVLHSLELVTRATRRNKTGNRANNADCLKAVVEPLSHLSKVQAISFNHKLTETFKMNPYTLKAYTGNQSYTLNLTRSMSDLGGIYA
jgi:hypothetical protein